MILNYEKKYPINIALIQQCQGRWPKKPKPYQRKAELPQVGTYFLSTQFPSLGIFINKKVGYQKN